MKKQVASVLVLSGLISILAACVPAEDSNVAYQPGRAAEVTPIENVAFKPIEQKDLLLAFNRAKSHDILYVLNLLKASPINYEALKTVACAVEHCDLADENWNWEALDSELVRVNLIDVLLQADKTASQSWIQTS
jgi:hypothetical protein